MNTLHWLSEHLFFRDNPLGAPMYLIVPLLATYFILFLLWLFIAWEVGWSVRLYSPLGLERTRRRLLKLGLFICLTLAFDAGYWFIATGAKKHAIFSKDVEDLLYEAILNLLEKVPLILAGVAFLVSFRTLTTLTDSEIDSKYFACFADRTLDAITVLDSGARVLYWNKSAERMFGWARGSVINKRIQDFMVPADRRKDLEDLLEKVRSTKEAVALDRTERLTHGGDKIAVSIDTAPILDPDFKGYFSIIRAAEARNPLLNNPYFREHGLPERIPGKVFVAMPYSTCDGGLDVWGQLLKPIERDLNLSLERADLDFTPLDAVEREFREIATSELVIADLTGNNPNVAYEVGVAHVLGIETVLLRTSEEIPMFNVRRLQVHYCDAKAPEEAQAKVRSAIVAARRPLPTC